MTPVDSRSKRLARVSSGQFFVAWLLFFCFAGHVVVLSFPVLLPSIVFLGFLFHSFQIPSRCPGAGRCVVRRLRVPGPALDARQRRQRHGAAGGADAGHAGLAAGAGAGVRSQEAARGGRDLGF